MEVNMSDFDPTLPTSREKQLIEAIEDILDAVGALSNFSEFHNVLNIDDDRAREILALIGR